MFDGSFDNLANTLNSPILTEFSPMLMQWYQGRLCCILRGNFGCWRYPGDKETFANIAVASPSWSRSKDQPRKGDRIQCTQGPLILAPFGPTHPITALSHFTPSCLPSMPLLSAIVGILACAGANGTAVTFSLAHLTFVLLYNALQHFCNSTEVCRVGGACAPQAHHLNRTGTPPRQCTG